MLGPAAADLARRQAGRISTFQLLELGFSEAQIATDVRHGHLHREHYGVYVVGARNRDRLGRLFGAWLAGGREATVGGWAAAWHLGATRSLRWPLEIVCPAHRRSRDGIRFRRVRLADDETQVVEGLRVTTVSRTLLDLAAICSQGEWTAVAEKAEQRQLADGTGLPVLLDRYPNAHGRRMLRRALDHEGLTSRTLSPLEDGFLALVVDAGLPRPLSNQPLREVEGEPTVDFVWRRERVVVELDGWEDHGTRKGFETDRRRDRALVRAGYTVLRFTYRDLQDDPDGVARDVGAAISASDRDVTYITPP